MTLDGVVEERRPCLALGWLCQGPTQPEGRCFPLWSPLLGNLCWDPCSPTSWERACSFAYWTCPSPLDPEASRGLYISYILSFVPITNKLEFVSLLQQRKLSLKEVK